MHDLKFNFKRQKFGKNFHEQLGKEREKKHDIEMTLKDVETVFQEE